MAKDKSQLYWDAFWEVILKMAQKHQHSGDGNMAAATQAAKKNGDALEESKYKDVSFERNGAKVVLPEDMSWDEVILWAGRRKSEDERQVEVHHEFQCFPMDGAVAFQRALKEIYGWADLVPTPHWWGNEPPAMIGIMTGPDQRAQVAWGRMNVQGIDGYLEPGMAVNGLVPRFTLNGLVKNKNLQQVQTIVKTTERMLKEQSIYKNQAVKISFEWQRLNHRFDPSIHCPQFIKLTGVSEDDLIFGKEVQTALDIGLFTPIQYADAMRQSRVPLKRGILLHGPYGTGKTLTATVTALKAKRHQWTFIYLDSVVDLKKGLAFAAQYGPSVLFVEDIDRAVKANQISMSEIQNCLDGVDTKGLELIVVFTTNHLDKIDSAMLRPGRIDTLVEVKAPDADAAARLVKLYGQDASGKNLFSDKTDFTQIGEALKNKIPALIREVVERGKIAAIRRLKGADITGQVMQEDILAAAVAMENHLALLNPKGRKPKKSPELLIRVPADYHNTVSEIMENLNGMNGEVEVETEEAVPAGQ